MKLVEILCEETTHNIPMSSTWSLDWNLTSGKRRVSDAIYQIKTKGLKPRVKNIPLDRVLATQDWIDLENGGNEPILPDYDDYPVVLYDTDYYHIMDGHHRIFYAITAGSHEITAYVFSEETL